VFSSESNPDEALAVGFRSNKLLKLEKVSTHEMFKNGLIKPSEVGYINLADVKINATEAFAISRDYLINYPNLIIDKCGDECFLALVYIKEYNAHFWILFCDINKEGDTMVVVNADTGEIRAVEIR